MGQLIFLFSFFDKVSVKKILGSIFVFTSGDVPWLRQFELLACATDFKCVRPERPPHRHNRPKKIRSAMVIRTPLPPPKYRSIRRIESGHCGFNVLPPLYRPTINWLSIPRTPGRLEMLSHTRCCSDWLLTLPFKVTTPSLLTFAINALPIGASV